MQQIRRVVTSFVYLKNMSKDINYYNKEGSMYSKKRYPEVDTEYVHFFFKKRREILMEMIRGIVSEKNEHLSLLEIGCADGVIIQGIKKQYQKFTRLVAVDIAPSMVAEAQRTSHSSIEFYVRGQEGELGLFDVVVEVGVINLTDMNAEFRFVVEHLSQDGYYICSLASRTSLLSRLKIKKNYFQNHLSFDEYESEIKKYFTIIDSEVYGIFVPTIWKVPFLGRIIQRIIEKVTKPLVPSLFHEKIYILQKNKLL